MKKNRNQPSEAVKSELPTPKFPKETVTLPVDFTPRRTLTPSHFKKIHEALGTGAVGMKTAIALRDLGVFARQMGIMETMRGSVLMSQSAIAAAISKMQSMMLDENMTPENRIQASRMIGYLSGQLQKVNSGSAKVESAIIQASQENEVRKRKSFAPGIPIILDVEEVKSA